MKTMIVIPAYNEEKSIYDVVMSVKSLGENIDVLVVNDGSDDNTESRARKAGAKVINLPINLGIGGAVQTGYIYACRNNYDCVVQVDGDGQHNAKDLPALLAVIESGRPICDRKQIYRKNRLQAFFFQEIGIKYFSRLVLFFTGRIIADTTSGYRAANKK
jgi:glycosyltransferase involved in cell wall biosynthesis